MQFFDSVLQFFNFLEMEHKQEKMVYRIVLTGGKDELIACGDYFSGVFILAETIIRF